MGAFDKKKAFGIGGLLTGAAAIIAVLANISEIVQLFKGDNKPEKPSNSVAVVENVEKNEEEAVIEQADVIEENYAEVVEEVPPADPQPSVVYLDSLKIADYDGYRIIDDSAYDTIGNTYIGHVCGIGDGDNSFATYYLGGKYKTLSGTIAVNDGSNGDYTGQIVISTDDNVVYATEEMGRVSVPVEFSINIENCQWLKITKLGGRHMNFGGTSFILSNFKLEE